MVVPILPVLEITPPLVIFQILDQLTFALVMTFDVVATVSLCVLIHRPLFQVLLYCMSKCCSTPPKQHQPGCCRRCMKTVFLSVGRWLCVNTFPALFKMYKTHSGHGSSQMRKFMVFLNRKVESSLVLIAAFCCLVYSIFSISTPVFFRYFPVEESGVCLEKDTHGRPLFCYINSSIPRYPNLPVDCANYTVTELREIEFKCYVIAIPGLGIAVAAALGLAKLGIVGVTICVKVTEAFFLMTKNPPRKLPWWCCCCKLPRTYANKIYIYLCWALLTIVLAVSWMSGFFFTYYNVRNNNTTVQSPRLKMYYIAYMLLPAQVCLPLAYVIKYLEAHCDREEYTSFAADQRPLDPRDWDEESESPMTEGQQDETSMQRVRECGNVIGEATAENEETLLLEARGNIEYTEFGATQL